MKYLFLSTAFFFCHFGAFVYAQIFSEIPGAQLPFESVSSSAVAFADIDGDDDEDVLITGMSDNGLLAKLYTNNGSGGFMEVETPFTGVSRSAVAFGDLNGNGFQDVIISGFLESNSPFEILTFIGAYANDGNGVFTAMAHPFTAVGRGSVNIADFDGDGDQDVLITGNASSDNPTTGIAELFFNNGSGEFTPAANTPFPLVTSSAADVADVDNDGDMDILLTGLSGSWVAKLFLNDGSGNFEENAGTPFTPVGLGSVVFADIDGDNDPDVLMTGTFGFGGPTPTPEQVAELFINDGNGNFTLLADTPFPESLDTSAAFEDVDGDGDLDLLISGRETDSFTILYLNDGNGAFSVSPGPEPFVFENVFRGSLAFSDIDSDGDQDVLITGLNSGAADTRLYLNGSTILSNSVAKDVSNNHFSIYPNPASSGTVNLRFGYEINNSATVRIFTLEGRELENFHINQISTAQILTIDIDVFETGLYVIQIQSDFAQSQGVLIVN